MAITILTYLVLCIGICTALHGFIKSNIILLVIDEKDFIAPEDINLKRKTNILNWIRFLKNLIITLFGFVLILKAIAVLTSSSYTLLTLLIIVQVLFLLWTIIPSIIMRKNSIDEDYENILIQWKNEKKVSDRHDDEVRFVRAKRDAINWFWTGCLSLLSAIFFVIVI